MKKNDVMINHFLLVIHSLGSNSIPSCLQKLMVIPSKISIQNIFPLLELKNIFESNPSYLQHLIVKFS